MFFSKREKYADRQINRIYFPLEASSSMMVTRCGHMFCEGCIRDVQVFLNAFFGILL
ncbi:putative Zinc finger, RING/FYVE/PHD-type, Zinc finger, C3HC4 RING-type [Helianthus anomalus]